MLQLPRVGWRLLACEKRSPDCIIVVVVVVCCLLLFVVACCCVLLLFQTIFQTECVCPHAGELIGRPGAKSPGSQTPGDSATPWSPRALTVVSARKLEKLALNSGTTGGARKMTQNASKTAQLPSFHHQTLSMTEAGAPPLTSTISSMICGRETPRSAPHRTS